MKWFEQLLFFLVVANLFSSPLCGAGANSQYSPLPRDVRVNPGAAVLLLTSTIQIPATTWIYAQTDGRYYPKGVALASADIKIDGQVVLDFADVALSGRRSSSAARWLSHGTDHRQGCTRFWEFVDERPFATTLV
jgi:hypothetical protein